MLYMEIINGQTSHFNDLIHLIRAKASFTFPSRDSFKKHHSFGSELQASIEFSKKNR